MLTVDYDRLGVRPGDRLLDLGCGFGRHAFEAARRGAAVVALDAGADEVAGSGTPSGPWPTPASSTPRRPAAARVQGDALHLPVRRRHLRPGHRLRGARAHPRRRGGHDRAGPGAASGRDHGGDRAPLRARVRQLGPLRRVPRRPRGPRPHLPPLHPAPAALGDRAASRWAATTPTVCTPPTGGSAAWWGRPTTPTRPWPRYHRLLVWDIVKGPRPHPGGRPGAQPADRQEPGRLPAQAGSAAAATGTGSRAEHRMAPTGHEEAA